jgi:hypothetical protein
MANVNFLIFDFTPETGKSQYIAYFYAGFRRIKKGSKRVL